MELIAVALIGAAGVVMAGVVGPVVLSRMNASQRLTERALDKIDRQEVALKVEAVREQGERAAALLLAEQRKINEKTDEVARVAAEAGAETSAAIEAVAAGQRQIHVLVNSEKTEGYEREMVTALALRSVLRRFNGNPSEDDKIALAGIETRIAELKRILAERLQASQVVAAEQATEPIRQKE